MSPAAEGLDLPGVVQAKDYLTESGRYPGKTVLVFGGGNTAIDVARTALRQGADSVRLAYRRTQADMPCTQEEWRIAQTEGVELIPLVAPDRMIATSGRLAGVECSQPPRGGTAGLSRRPKQCPAFWPAYSAGVRSGGAGTGL